MAGSETPEGRSSPPISPDGRLVPFPVSQFRCGAATSPQVSRRGGLAAPQGPGETVPPETAQAQAACGTRSRLELEGVEVGVAVDEAEPYRHAGAG